MDRTEDSTIGAVNETTDISQSAEGHEDANSREANGDNRVTRNANSDNNTETNSDNNTETNNDNMTQEKRIEEISEKEANQAKANTAAASNNGNANNDSDNDADNTPDANMSSDQSNITTDTCNGGQSNQTSQITEATHLTDERKPSDQPVTITRKSSNVNISKNENLREHTFKILVVGEYGVGKTSIIRRYTEGVYNSNYRLTIGVDFAAKSLKLDDNTNITLQLWDIAGHERFGSMTRVYYKHAVGAILVYDITRNATIDAAKKVSGQVTAVVDPARGLSSFLVKARDAGVTGLFGEPPPLQLDFKIEIKQENCCWEWLNDVNAKVMLPNGDPIPVILLANKCELVTDELEKHNLQTLCEELGIRAWFATSAKDNIHIDSSIEHLVKEIIGVGALQDTEAESKEHLERSTDLAQLTKDPTSLDDDEDEEQKKRCCIIL